MNLTNANILVLFFSFMIISCKVTPKGGRVEDPQSAQGSDSARDLDSTSDSGSDDNFWGNDNDDDGLSPKALTYNSDIKSIVDRSCVSCHGNTSGSVYPNLSTYDLLKFSAQRSVTFIESGRMPKDPVTMSNEDKEKFKAWVEEGMKEGDGSSSGASNDITYGEIRSLVQNACGDCHTTGRTYPPLGDESSLKNNGQAAISSVEAGRMPPPSSGKSLLSSDLSKLKKWLDNSN